MSKTRRRLKARRRQERRLARNHGPLRTCPNCLVSHRDEGHYVPPSLGDPGFFMCEPAP